VVNHVTYTVSNSSRTYRDYQTNEGEGLIRPEEKKSTASAFPGPCPITLILTLTLNHLANKLQQTTSALFGLMYPRTAQWDINIFTMDYKYL